jgi:hypothetical protein
MKTLYLILAVLAGAATLALMIWKIRDKCTP